MWNNNSLPWTDLAITYMLFDVILAVSAYAILIGFAMSRRVAVSDVILEGLEAAVRVMKSGDTPKLQESQDWSESDDEHDYDLDGSKGWDLERGAVDGKMQWIEV